MKQKSLLNILVRVCKDSRFHSNPESSPGFITSPTRSICVEIKSRDDQKMAGIPSCFSVSVRDGRNEETFVIQVRLNWKVSQVKRAITAQSGWQPSQFRLVFAGSELNDYATLGDAGLQGATTLHCIRTTTFQLLRPLVPAKPVLNNVNLGDVEPASLDSSGEGKCHFYVYCAKPCKAITPGKLRVRCSQCKDTSFVIDQVPRNWADVLTPQQMHGCCSNPACKGNKAEFYFKCAIHSTSDEETSFPLHKLRSNNIRVECITCLEVPDQIFIFDCVLSHSMCIPCFFAYVKDALTHRRFKRHPDYGYTLTCPALCKDSEVKNTHHFALLGEDFYRQYQRLAAEEFLHEIGGIFCPSRSCGAGFVPEDDQQEVKCVECKFVFCRKCKGAHHSESCKTHEANMRYIAEKTRPCPACCIPIEKGGGSNHMTCFICKCEFCWLCVIEWNENCRGSHWFY